MFVLRSILNQEFIIYVMNTFSFQDEI